MVEQVPQQLAQQPPESKPAKIFLIGFLIFFILLASMIALWWWDSHRLVVADQPLDNLLTVEKAVLTQPGFIFVYNTNNLGERGSLILGQTALLEPGFYEHFTVDINTDVTNQTGEKLLQPGDKVLFIIQRQVTGQGTETTSATRGIFGRELKTVVTLN